MASTWKEYLKKEGWPYEFPVELAFVKGYRISLHFEEFKFAQVFARRSTIKQEKWLFTILFSIRPLRGASST